MEEFSQSNYGLGPISHVYPDPDYAAYVTKYPWLGDDGYIPSALHGLPSKSLEEIPRSGSYESPWKAGDDESEFIDSVAQAPAKEVTWDPDYQVSDAVVTYLVSSVEIHEIII